MKARLAAVATAAVLVLLVAGCTGAAPQKPALAPGMAVAAPWHGALHLGSIASIDGAVVNVRYAFDGQVRMVKEIAVRPVLARQWHAGDRVLAVSGGRFDPGTVVLVRPGAYAIKWKDGSPQSDVPADKIIAP